MKFRVKSPSRRAPTSPALKALYAQRNALAKQFKATHRTDRIGRIVFDRSPAMIMRRRALWPALDRVYWAITAQKNRERVLPGNGQAAPSTPSIPVQLELEL
jgi:hypothetical protein